MRIECDGEVMDLDFRPREHTTAEAAAKAFYEALKPLVVAAGQQIETELSILTPEEARERFNGAYAHWWVIWEAGPYDWGVTASLSGLSAPTWYTEPYWGFDVMFIGED